MAFDVVSATQKHLYVADACGRILSAIVAGPVGEEQLVAQQELAGIKCRERMLHGGMSIEGVGTNAAFTFFWGRWYSGASLALFTDKVTGNKYMAVAEGWKSKLRAMKVGRINRKKSPKPLQWTGQVSSKTDDYTYEWDTPRPDPKIAYAVTVSPIVAPRKLSAGEEDNIFMTTQAAMIWDVDLRPQVACPEMRRVFKQAMLNNPANYWKHHFGFDKWLPDQDDNSEETCQVTNECHGNSEYGEPVCNCDGEIKYANGTVCKTHEWDRCSAKTCKSLGSTCKSTALRGKSKQEWAKKWWQVFNEEKLATYHQGWVHYPIRRLRKTLRYCLVRKADNPPDPFEEKMDPEKTPPEKLEKEIEKKAATYQLKMASVHEECGRDYGSWWVISLMKQVQMVKHMCGPPSPESNGQPTPRADCPVVYISKTTMCNMQEARPEQPPLCCVDKRLSNYLSPRMGVKKGFQIPAELHQQVVDKMKLF